jgi:serine/threonine protein kinase
MGAVAALSESEPTDPPVGCRIGGLLVEKLRQARVLSRLKHPNGMLRYMSPEHARGEPAMPASDLYALGLILYELYTGRSAYPRELEDIDLLNRLQLGQREEARAMAEKLIAERWHLSPWNRDFPAACRARGLLPEADTP